MFTVATECGGCTMGGPGGDHGTGAPTLLNAPPSSMSAFEDDPGHFATWLQGGDLGFRAADFVPRHLYRRYLQDVLRDELLHAAPGTELTWVRELVTSLRMEQDSEGPVATLRFGQGRRCRADAVVLALGAPAPVALGALDVSPTFGMIRDPWCPGALDAVPARGDVLVLGTGLTMVDVAVVLTGADRRRTVHARRRRPRPTVGIGAT